MTQVTSPRTLASPSTASPFIAPPVSAAQRTIEAPAFSDIPKIYRGYKHVTLSDTEYETTLVKSAHRVMQVFEFFAEYQKPASASMIAINLDFPQSSTSMLLRSLVALGYLHYDQMQRLYEPTVRMSLLGAWNGHRTRIALNVIELMSEINRETGECVLLAEQYRHYVRYIYVMQSTDPQKVYYIPHGTVRPICTTAFGQMLLTLKSEKDLRALIHHARSDEDSVDYGVSIQEIVGQVSLCRELGHSRTSRAVDDFRSYQIATLLPERREGSALAIGVTAYGDDFLQRSDAILARLRALTDRFRWDSI